MSRFQVLTAGLLLAAGALQMAMYVDRGATENDLIVDYSSAKELVAGRSPYSPIGPLVRRHVEDSGAPLAYPVTQKNPHPPTAILLALPFTSLPFELVRRLWLLPSILAVTMACYIAAREFGYQESTARLIGFGAFALPVTHDALITLQIEPILLAATVFGWVAMSRGHDRRAGLLFGLVVALKIYPVILLAALARRHRRTLLWSLVSTGAFLMSGVLVVGWSDSILWGSDISAENLNTWGTAYYNLSLPGLLLKALVGTWSRLPDWATLLYIAAFLAAVVLATRGDLWDAAPGMVLATPVAWTTYTLFTLPLLIRGVRRRPRGLWLLGALLLAGGHHLQKIAVGLPTLGLVLVIVAGGRSGRRANMDAPGRREDASRN